jgi:cation/acetate symporter
MTDGARARTELADHLRRICSACALGFLALTILLVILERDGLAKEIVGGLFVLCPLALYAGIGLTSHTADRSDYQVAGHRIPAVFAGMAAGADWGSAAILFVTTGSFLLGGYDGRWLLIGLTGGYVLSAVLVAPFLRSRNAPFQISWPKDLEAWRASPR